METTNTNTMIRQLAAAKRAPGRRFDAVIVTAQLYELRNTAQRLLGPGYAEKMATFSGFIRAAMKKHRTENPVQAALILCKELEVEHPEAAMTQLFMLAAAVEMQEPSEPARRPQEQSREEMQQ